jgi:uncharacterized paraquat-inducible protein A
MANQPPKQCRHCGTACDPASVDSGICPACHGDLGDRARSLPWNALIAGAILVLPLITLLVAHALFPGADVDPIIALKVAPVMALIGGIVLGVRLGNSVERKILLAVALPPVLLVGADVILFAGCTMLR